MTVKYKAEYRDLVDKIVLLRTLGMEDGEIVHWLGIDWSEVLKKMTRIKKRAAQDADMG